MAYDGSLSKYFGSPASGFSNGGGLSALTGGGIPSTIARPASQLGDAVGGSWMDKIPKVPWLDKTSKLGALSAKLGPWLAVGKTLSGLGQLNASAGTNALISRLKEETEDKDFAADKAIGRAKIDQGFEDIQRGSEGKAGALARMMAMLQQRRNTSGDALASQQILT